ncbi:Ig-like domain-containing protein [Stigmatella sp. ncwal1]|uniref:Ig-like domain-containing protein n=1 Tax=Stigmatella ashevillensis TaxID=2995309 RepID=A0ABT5D7H9_9BACT|nr:Ig-like domain-containing protein [Stigmatella ashevillena]MDC0709014.1 Ig-like domain-containing protein [Stigmatella ashevillena]
MTLFKRLIPLLLLVLQSACIQLPEVGDAAPPETPDAGVPADTASPTITAVSPQNDSTQVAIDSQIQLIFSEPMDENSVQIRIAPLVLFSALEWSNGNTVVTFQPASPLAQNTAYTIVVDGKDRSGNPLSDRKAFSFSTTGPAPDTTPPTALRATPSHGAIGIARAASITVMFSEPMDKAAAQTAFAITSPPGFNSGVFDWNAAGTEMTFNPDVDFPYGTDVTWRVSTTAKDLSGNTLETNVTSTFRVIRTNTVTIDFDPATSGSAAAPDYWKQSHYYNFELVGDNIHNKEYRLFIGFKTDALPENLTSITRSLMKWHQTGRRGAPFSSLGNLLLERVYIGDEIALSTNDWTNPSARIQYESTPIGPAMLMTDGNPTSPRVFDVRSFIILDWQDRHSRHNKRSQFRLRFESPSNGNSAYDCLQTDQAFTPKLAELEVSYEYP